MEDRHGRNWEDELLLGHLRHEKEVDDMFEKPYRYHMAHDPTGIERNEERNALSEWDCELAVA